MMKGILTPCMHRGRHCYIPMNILPEISLRLCLCVFKDIVVFAQLLFESPCTAVCQASLPFTILGSLVFFKKINLF